MKCVTYNIQYGFGMDGAYDLGRIIDAVRDADVIALQEVTSNSPENDGRDMVDEITALLPDRYFVYGAPYELEMGSSMKDGRMAMRTFQFGNMVLSRTPILASRNLLLPRMRTWDKLNLQRGALEAMIVTPAGPLRFYSVHLDHTSPTERLAQIRFLMERATRYAIEGGAVTGTSERGFPEPPHPEDFVLMGDFNMSPDGPEYAEITGLPDYHYGATLRAGVMVDPGAGEARPVTWISPEHADEPFYRRCLDYCFASPGLAPRITRNWVDEDAQGSDHRPVWLELE